MRSRRVRVRVPISPPYDCATLIVMVTKSVLPNNVEIVYFLHFFPLKHSTYIIILITA